MYKCIWFNTRLCIVFECIAILQHVTVKRHFIWEHGYPYMCMFICTLQAFDLFDALLHYIHRSLTLLTSVHTNTKYMVIGSRPSNGVLHVN